MSRARAIHLGPIARRRTLAACVSVATLIFMGLMWQPEVVPHGERGQADDLAMGNTRFAEWSRLEDANGFVLARLCMDRIGGEFRENRLAMPQPQALETDMSIVMGSMLSGEFAPFAALMRSKSCALDQLADGFSEYLDTATRYQMPDVDSRALVPRYGPEVPDAVRAGSVEQRVGYMWEHPEPRDVQIVAIALDSVRLGSGLRLDAGRDWPWTNSCLQRSLYSPRRGRLGAEEGASIERGGAAVWIQMDVICAPDTRTTMRVFFYFDDVDRIWIPFCAAIGAAPGIRPMPML